MTNRFAKKLLQWHKSNPREMPWKETGDPYKIWLSEIILQQTRVDQGLPYYESIVKKYPTVKHLAAASEDEVLKSWEGLGYYSRARNLHSAAKQVVKDFKGKFPPDYGEILKLKGIGPYSAAAISSFAFGLPHAVLDGNVFRVLARYLGIREPTDNSNGKKLFTKIANDLLDKKQPAAYNQAIMNFGAMVCKPANPLCAQCIFRKECIAFNKNLVHLLPVKEKKIAIRSRWFNFFVLESKQTLVIEKREADDIWKGLYQLPLMETKSFEEPDQLQKKFMQSHFGTGHPVINQGISDVVTHKLTHQTIFTRFVRLRLNNVQTLSNNKWIKVKKRELKNFGFPKVIDNYLKKLLL